MEDPDAEIVQILGLATEEGKLKKEQDDRLGKLLEALDSLQIQKELLGLGGWAALARHLHEASKLSSLLLKDKYLRNEDCTKLAAALPKLRGLTSLDIISGPSTRNEGTAALAKALQKLPELKSLGLHFSNLSRAKKGAANIAQGLSSLGRLTSLRLSCGGFKDGEVAAIAKALMQVKQLKCLDIGGLHFQEAGARALADAFQRATGLASLDVQAPGGEALKMFLGGLLMLKQLTTLDLTIAYRDTPNFFGGDGVGVSKDIGALAGAIRELRGLASLSLSVIGNMGEAEAKALAGLDQLRSLRLRVRDESLNKWCQGLVKANKLTYLDLGENSIQDEGAKAVGMALTRLPQLTSLYLAVNQIGDGGAEAIVKGLRQSSNFTSLDLQYNLIASLPLELASLPALIDLRVIPARIPGAENTNLQFPPPEVVEQGTAAVLDFLRQARREKTNTRANVKLMFVGPGGVGKSSLFRALEGRAPVAEGTKTTVGVDVTFWEWKPDVAENDVPITFRVFDCAGQKQYGTMQRLFFTTEHCIYVLVFNVNNDKTKSGEIKERLDSIQAVAPGSTFVLVGTHSDKVEDADVAQQRMVDMHTHIRTALDQDLEAIAQHAEIDLDFYIRQPPELWDQPFLVSSTEYRGVRELEETLINLVRRDPDSFVRTLPRSWVSLFDKVVGIQPKLANQAVEGTVEEETVQVGALLEVHLNDLWEG